jgi:hypothetical protein
MTVVVNATEMRTTGARTPITAISADIPGTSATLRRIPIHQRRAVVPVGSAAHRTRQEDQRHRLPYSVDQVYTIATNRTPPWRS